MRESNFTIGAALSNGLRPDARLAHDDPYCEKLTNLKPSEFGLISPEPIELPLESLPVAVSWPYPQVFKGARITLLCYDTAIYDITSGSAVTLTTYDFYDWASTLAIPADGGPWHFCDFYDSWMLFKDGAVVMQHGGTAKTLVQTSMTIRTGCNWNDGRVVLGSFDPDDFRTAGWQAFLETYDGELPASLTALLDYSKGADKNWVFWSGPGTGEEMALMDHTFAIYGAFSSVGSPYSPKNPWIVEAWLRNLCGARPLPFQGQLLCTAPLGQHVICYGEDGICALTDSQGIVGMPEIRGLGDGIGIASRCAVSMRADGHLFIDQLGELWRLTPNLECQRLGYGEYLAGMLGNEIIGSFDSLESDSWFSDGVLSYVFSRTGLGGSMDQKPTGLHRAADGALVGAHLDDETDKVEFISQPFEIAERGKKTLTWVQASISGLTDMRMKCYWKNDRDEAWKGMPAKPVNPQGVSRFPCKFTDGKLQLTGTVSANDARVQRFELRYNADDKRFRRGTKGFSDAS